jgi:pimeloyl-ACP methyl ester carboxylesterase
MRFGQDRLTTERHGQTRAVKRWCSYSRPGDRRRSVFEVRRDAAWRPLTLTSSRSPDLAAIAPPDSIDPVVVPAAEAVDRIMLNSAGQNNVVLVGHSLGAPGRPASPRGAASDRVSRVVVVDSAALLSAGLMQPGADPQMVFGRSRDMPCLSKWLRCRVPAFFAMMRQGLPRRKASTAKHQEQVVELGLASPINRTVASGLRRRSWTGDLRHHLDAVSAPVTLIYARQSTMISQ